MLTTWQQAPVYLSVIFGKISLWPRLCSTLQSEASCGPGAFSLWPWSCRWGEGTVGCEGGSQHLAFTRSLPRFSSGEQWWESDWMLMRWFLQYHHPCSCIAVIPGWHFARSRMTAMLFSPLCFLYTPSHALPLLSVSFQDLNPGSDFLSAISSP